MIVRGSLAHLTDLVDLFDQYRMFYKRTSDRSAATHFLTQRIQNKESVIFLYYIANVAVGFTQLYPKYSSANMVQNWILNDLFVTEEHRKTGVGRQLINAAVAFAQDQGSTFILLETQQDNTAAQSLYRNMGFVQQVPDEEFLPFKKNI